MPLSLSFELRLAAGFLLSKAAAMQRPSLPSGRFGARSAYRRLGIHKLLRTRFEVKRLVRSSASEFYLADQSSIIRPTSESVEWLE